MISDGAGAQRDLDRSLDRRELILRQAGELFARYGYSATTVRQIADAAELLSGSLYHHFPSKESILLEIVEEFFTEVTTRHRAELAARREPVEALRGLVRGALEVIGRNPHAAVVVVGESRRLRDTAYFDRLAERTRATTSLWAGVLRAGVERGELRRDLNPGVLCLMLQTTVWGMAHWYRASGPYKPAAAARMVTDLFVHGLARPDLHPRRDLGLLLGPARDARPGERMLPVGIRVEPDEARDVADVTGGDARDRIKAAAGLLFARQGYAATTVRQIADAAGVPAGSLSHHIGSKEQLLTDLLGGFLDDLNAEFGSFPETGDPVLQLARLIDGTAGALAGRGMSTVLLVNELSRRELAEKRTALSDRWTRALCSGLSTGAFPVGMDPLFIQRVVRTAVTVGGATFRAYGVPDVGALYAEVLLGGMGSR